MNQGINKRTVTDSCSIFNAESLIEAFQKGSVYINRRHSVSNYDELRALHVMYEDLLEHRDSIMNKDEIPVYEATLKEASRLLEIIHQDLRDTFPRRSAIFHDCNDPIDPPLKKSEKKGANYHRQPSSVNNRSYYLHHNKIDHG